MSAWSPGDLSPSRMAGTGVFFNDGVTEQRSRAASTEPSESIFTRVHKAGGTTAVFAGKEKFDIFENTWSRAIDRSVVKTSLQQLTASAAADLRSRRRTFTFLHIAPPDLIGHRSGWLSPDYLNAVHE